MALPPTLPLLEPPAEHWSAVQDHWTDSVGRSAEARLLGRFEVLRPYLHEAVRELAVRHFLLMDESALITRLALVLDQRTSLPSTSTIFRYHVASLALRMVKEERLVKLSRLDDPMAPWHAFRHRVNQLRRSFRGYFLAFLPKHSFAPMLFEKPRREPSKHWVVLWDSLTDGIPGGGIPSEWAEVRQSYSPKLIPGAFANRGGGLIAPARDWKEILAKPLLQAAALIESRRPGLMPLYVPQRSLPRSERKMWEALRSVISRFELSSGNGSKAEILSNLISHVEMEISSPSLDIKPLELVRLAIAEGIKDYSAHVLEASILDRQGRSKQSMLAFSRCLQAAQGRSEIGIALMNLGVNDFWQGNIESSICLLMEARRYSPDSQLIVDNLSAVLRYGRASIDPANENGT